MDEQRVDIAVWIQRQMERMDAWEAEEWAVLTTTEKYAGAAWIVRALADPTLAGSGTVLDAIHERRDAVSAREQAKLAEWQR